MSSKNAFFAYLQHDFTLEQRKCRSILSGDPAALPEGSRASAKTTDRTVPTSRQLPEEQSGAKGSYIDAKILLTSTKRAMGGLLRTLEHTGRAPGTPLCHEIAFVYDLHLVPPYCARFAENGSSASVCTE